MQRFAIFVDAGYLFAGGANCLFQSTKRRNELSFDIQKAAAFLKEKSARLCAPSCSLLRIYWYDGASEGRLSTDQQLIANTNDIKLRLGIINSLGQQKGVDAKIVTDLVELSRNQSISDAILLGGDEDLRIGIELAQEYGIRAHLLCIDRAGTSPTLKQECDTVTILTHADLGDFIQLKPQLPTLNPDHQATTIPEVVMQYIQQLSPKDISDLKQIFQNSRSTQIPKEHDGKLLAKAGEALDRKLDSSESTFLRNEFKTSIRNQP